MTLSLSTSQTTSQSQRKKKEMVVLVPGLFSPRLTMVFMARRLRSQGYKTHLFPNRFLLKTPPQNAQRLVSFLQNLPDETIHLVGHSLGGIVIMNALSMNTKAPEATRFATGRVVLIGSPVRGSAVAVRLHNKRAIGWILGRSAKSGLLQAAPSDVDGRELGVISGSSAAGLVSMVNKPAEAYDGVVSEAETTVDQAKDSVSIPQSHAQMLFSTLASELTLQFLKHGEFSPKPHV